MTLDNQVYNLSRRRLLGLLSLAGVGSVEARNPTTPEYSQPMPALFFDGRHAYANGYHPLYIHHIVHHANALAHLPYKVGGGHRDLVDKGYDCSGSISYVLFRSGLLNYSLTSAQFAQYGNPGPGKYVTLYVNPGEHIFMTVCGLRYDTSGSVRHEGPRWRTEPRNYSGFQQRCIPGL